MRLGDFLAKRVTFPQLSEEIASLLQEEERDRHNAVGTKLLQWIQKTPSPCFLLAPVLEFIAEVDRSGVIPHYAFSHFELWLNQSSGLSFEENRKIRGKIIGKWVDRSDYQVFFPVGMGKVYEGTHFVTAHKSPDLDTTIASFWGWVDAFGARVGNGLHVWNLPGGPPSSQIEIQWIFQDLFGSAVFTHLPKTRTTLNLTARDLMTRVGMGLKCLDDSIAGIDHEREHGSVVVVDQNGGYLGDWRSFDVEQVRQMIILVSVLLRWFENQLYLHLIAFFAKPKLQFESIRAELEHLFSMELRACEPMKECAFKQKKDVTQFLSHVLGIKEGLSISFENFGAHLARFAEIDFGGLDLLIQAMKPLFNKQGELIEDRPKIFAFLEITVRELHASILKVRVRLEKLDVALMAKSDVFGHHPTFVTLRSDVDEILQKMGSYVSLTVADSEGGTLFPAGVIQAQDVRKKILGTVSLRDFCNREEMGIPPYLDVISVIDHHKSQLHTSAPPFAIIADAQSSNSLVARQAFEINDQHSLGGLTAEAIESQIELLSKEKTPAATRLLQRLLKKRNLAAQTDDFFVDVMREYTEYLHFLYAILDDTDLLSKVTVIDLECVVSLLNRLKSLVVGKEVEVLSLDDLPKDAKFLKSASQRILQNEEMYSLYHKVYAYREKEVGEHIALAALGKPSHLFQDTKVQNGCCRIGQTKVFPRNIALFATHAKEIQKWWVEASSRIYQEHKEIDLHIHMISTVVSADEVYGKSLQNNSHQDEMWIWIPSNQEIAAEHLKQFLVSFRASPGLKGNPLSLFLSEGMGQEYQAFLEESLPQASFQTVKGDLPIIVLRYKAGSLNSRKAMVAPFLPSI